MRGAGRWFGCCRFKFPGAPHFISNRKGERKFPNGHIIDNGSRCITNQRETVGHLPPATLPSHHHRRRPPPPPPPPARDRCRTNSKTNYQKFFLFLLVSFFFLLLSFRCCLSIVLSIQWWIEFSKIYLKKTPEMKIVTIVTELLVNQPVNWCWFTVLIFPSVQLRFFFLFLLLFRL